ncbi:variant leucine-rich repeat-containing protein [Thermosynechococcus sp. FA-CM-4201]
MADSFQKDCSEWQAIALDPKTPAEQLWALAMRNDALAVLVAQNPAIPISLIERLVEKGKPEILRALASNPQTPKEILLPLAEHFPEEVFANPVLEILWHLDPDLKDLSLSALRALLLNPKTADWAWFLVPDRERHSGNLDDLRTLWFTLKEVAAAPETPLSVLNHLLNFSKEIVADRLNYIDNKSYGIFSPPNRIRSLSSRIQETIGARTDIPVELLCQWAQDKDRCCSGLRKGIAKNPNCPIFLLEELIHDPIDSVRCAAAENPNLPIQSMVEIMRDYGSEGTEQVMFNVRAWLASNPNLPRELLMQLLNDSSHSVHVALANRPDLPEEAIETLSRHESIEVIAALSQKDICADLIRLASNPQTDGDRLIELSHHWNLKVLLALVKNPMTPPIALKQIGSHPHLKSNHLEEIVFGLLEHPSCPNEVFEKALAVVRAKDSSS